MSFFVSFFVSSFVLSSFCFFVQCSTKVLRFQPGPSNIGDEIETLNVPSTEQTGETSSSEFLSHNSDLETPDVARFEQLDEMNSLDVIETEGQEFLDVEMLEDEYLDVEMLDDEFLDTEPPENTDNSETVGIETPLSNAEGLIPEFEINVDCCNNGESDDEESDDEEYEDAEEDPEWLPPTLLKKQKKEKITKGFVQKALDDPEVSAVAMARGITPGSVSHLTAAMNYANSEPNKGNSKGNIHVKHKKHRRLYANNVREKTKTSLAEENGASFLHWDEKQLENATQEQLESNFVERCAILASNKHGAHLLAIRKLVSATGCIIADACVFLLQLFCFTSSIVGIVFDTTASNTGFENGAGPIIERRVGKKLLYLACRHHVYEIFLRSAYEMIVSKSTSPFAKMSETVKTMWGALDFDDVRLLELPKSTNKLIVNAKQSLIGFYESIIDSQVRNDYREAAELAITLLGGTKRFFKKPAGDSNARWMSKFLYTAKAYMFGNQLGFADTEIKLYQTFLTFCVVVYLPAWFKCSMICEAAVTDIEFARRLDWFSKIQSNVSKTLLEKLNNHSWYLGSELAWTCLFSNSITAEQQQKIINKLKRLKPNWNKRSIKLKGTHALFTKRDKLIAVKNLKLEDLINETSLAVMQQLNISLDDLEKAQQVAKSIPCTNDVAERAIQLASKFNNQGPRNEEDRQDYYLTIDDVQNRHLKTMTHINDFYSSYSGPSQ